MPLHPLCFFTATIKDWISLLKDDKYKDIIINSLRFLVNNKRVNIYCFVIMPNHIHLIWQIKEGHKKENVQRDFLKYIAEQIKFDLAKNDPKALERFKVNLKDREYQIWKHRPLSIDLYSDAVIEQKLDYIHNNPIHEKWKLVEKPEEYKYSSASFYLTDLPAWDFLSHYKEL
jgi:putative transposase